MERNILTQISKENSGFSKGQRLIAKYILEEYDKAAFMTASRLGKTVGVSESTVVRFAVDLGYAGYPEMRKALQEVVRNRLTSLQRIEVAKDTLGAGNLLKAVISSDIDKLHKTLDDVSQESFDAAVAAIIAAKRLYVMGMRSSSALSNYMGLYLDYLRDNVRQVHDSAVSEVYEQIMRIDKGDVIVGISFPRYSSRTLKAMKFAKSRGATVISITDNEASPLVEVSDIVLYAKSDMISFLDSLVAPLSLINAIIVAVSMHAKDELAKTFTSLEEVWSEYDVYITGDN